MRIVVAVVVPFVIDAIYLYFSRWPEKWDNGMTDLLFLAISLGTGTAFLATLPLRGGIKAVLSVIYVPVTGVVLFYFTIFFIAIVFKDAI